MKLHFLYSVVAETSILKVACVLIGNYVSDPYNF